MPGEHCCPIVYSPFSHRRFPKCIELLLLLSCGIDSLVAATDFAKGYYYVPLFGLLTVYWCEIVINKFFIFLLLRHALLFFELYSLIHSLLLFGVMCPYDDSNTLSEIFCVFFLVRHKNRNVISVCVNRTINEISSLFGHLLAAHIRRWPV